MSNALRLIAFASLLGLAGCPATARPPVTGDDAAVAGADLASPPDLRTPADLASPCGPCSAPTPVCDVKTKRCVVCATDSDCPAAAICVTNQCVPGCSANHAECGDAGSCDVDMGRCHGCLADADCKDPNAPFCDVASGRCGACSPQTDRCPVGQYCAPKGNGFACATGCKDDGECLGMGQSFRCCAHACVDTKQDKANCGGCGTACGNGGACCGGACATVDNDVKNCGACGTVCPSNNTMPTCVAGKCGSNGCLPGFGDCDQNAQNGCETSLQSDARNCGACGMNCGFANAAAGCLGGKCAILSCNQGFRNCNGLDNDGCEIDARSDPNNCGTCGQSCNRVPHAAAGCSMSMCAVGMCDPGWGNCDNNGNNGCESDLSMDPANCGACGNACTGPANVILTCVNKVCGTGGCKPGYADCDNNMGNGCEADLRVDAKNCGVCGKVCPIGANATGACAGMACTFACNAGFGDCDGNQNNGCETNVTNDVKNCGACNNVCPQGQLCSAGKCTATGGWVYMTSSNGTAGFYGYDVNANKWSILPNPPAVTYSQITTDHSVVYLLGRDNVVYKYTPGNMTWAQAQTGPGNQSSSPIGFFKWTQNGFYYAKDGSTTFYRSANGGAWTSQNLANAPSCAGTYDPASGLLYIRIYGNLGMMIYDTNQNTVTKTFANGSSCGENSRTGSYYNGYFYERDWGAVLQKMDVTSGVLSSTGVTPIEQHTASDVNLLNGDIYIGPYTPSGTAFQLYKASNNTLSTLAQAPVAVTNHSTIVYVRP